MNHTLIFAFSAAALVLAQERSARADEPAPVTSPAPSTPADSPRSPPTTEWYGWETMATDGASAAFLALSAVSDNDGARTGLAVVGLTGFGLGAPVVHATRGRWGLALADLGLRVGAVALGGLAGGGIGAATEPRVQPCTGAGFGAIGCAVGGAVSDVSYVDSAVFVGAAIGALAASALDAAVLSRQTVHRKDEPTPTFSWSPSLTPLKDGAAGGITGTF